MVGTTCTYQHDPAHPGMDAQGLYSELSHLSRGVTQLGNYTLEKHSLYVNGEHGLWFAMWYLSTGILYFLYTPICS